MIKKLLAAMLALLLSTSVFTGCVEEEEVVTEQPLWEVRVAMLDAPIRLDPIYATDTATESLLLHLYEPLMTTTVDDQGMVQVTNGLAKSVTMEMDIDGTATYTFTLRQAKWSDGESVTAHDFVYAWKRLANPVTFSPNAELLSLVVGYDTVQATGDTDALGVLAVDNTTFQVTVNGGYDWFLEEVCTSPATVPLRQDVVAELKAQADILNIESGTNDASWSSTFTELVTCGPYLVDSVDDGAVMLATQSYYGNSFSGPDLLTFTFVDDAQAGWDAFVAQEVDFTYPLPEAELALVLAESQGEDVAWELYTAADTLPSLSPMTVLINHENPVLSEVLVRKGLDEALDRQALAEVASIGAKAAEGLVPYGIMESDTVEFREVGALLDVAPNLTASRQALALGGYDDGTAQLNLMYIDDETNQAVAELLCQQWAAVGVTVTPVAMTYSEYVTALYAKEYDLALAEVTPTVKDAEYYLTPFTSQNTLNVIGYENSAFDTLLTIAFSAEDHSGRIGCLHDAESLLLDDYALLPLYTQTRGWALAGDLSGVVEDARGWFTFSTVGHH